MNSVMIVRKASVPWITGSEVALMDQMVKAARRAVIKYITHAVNDFTDFLDIIVSSSDLQLRLQCKTSCTFNNLW